MDGARCSEFARCNESPTADVMGFCFAAHLLDALNLLHSGNGCAVSSEVGKDSSQILVLGATNTPWDLTVCYPDQTTCVDTAIPTSKRSRQDLDSAIRRRFEKRVYIPLPA